MKISTGRIVWGALVVCAAIILAAMTWQTRATLASERERAAAEARADLQERMRLALWRMDTLGASLILAHGQSPPDVSGDSFVRGRFLWSQHGVLPAGSPVPLSGDPAALEQIRDFLVRGGFDWSSLPVPREPPLSRSLKAQQDANTKELVNRGRAIDNVVSQDLHRAPDAGSFPRALWIDGELYLLRLASRVPAVIHGAWLDAVPLENHLLGEIRDLLPAARLLPSDQPSDDGLVLASFPFRLDPGIIPVGSSPVSGPIAGSLAVGWAAAVIAILTASLLVFGVMRLSERRASFVSAVTHELRTPLTTFRLYSEMLEAGAVKPEKRGDYLRSLSREADRLSHLVENVLAFSRIEKGSARSAVATLSAADLLEPMRERFEARLSTAGLRLRMDPGCPAAASLLRVDAAVVEHILFNLIDNAAKYAAASEPPEVGIRLHQTPGRLEIHVMDHGPGIPPAERRRIFRAFHKSARDAAETRPGVGLGLALSRRLARSLGGTLSCADPPGGGGACFVLSLRTATGPGGSVGRNACSA